MDLPPAIQFSRNRRITAIQSHYVRLYVKRNKNDAADAAAICEAVKSARLEDKIRPRRETVEHPFGTIKAWMGFTHFQMKTLARVGAEMALHVLAYNIKRVINIIGIRPLFAAMTEA